MIPDFIGCPLFLSVIGPKEIAPTGQSDAKLAQDKTFLYFRQFICFYFDLSLALKDISFLLTSQRDYFGFDFTTLNPKVLFTICD